MSHLLMHIPFLFNREKRLNEKTGKREPVGYQYQFREPWNPLLGQLGVRYKAHQHFRDGSCPYPEESKKLNRMMPADYILLSWERSSKGKEEADRLSVTGVNELTLPGYKGEPMRFCFGWTRDDHYKAIFSTKPVTLADIGWRTKIDSVAAAIKFEKYIGRDLAPHLFEVNGHVDVFRGDEIEVTLENGAKIKVAIRPKSIYNDGIMPVSERGAQLLAGIDDPKPGMGFGGTCDTGVPMIGFGKGNGLIIPWLKYDLVLYDIKQLLVGPEGQFWFGRLKDNVVGEPYLDIQTLINTCGATPAGLNLIARKVDQADRRTLRDIQDFDSLESRFLARTADKETVTWIVERAAQMNIHPVFGALFRSFASPEMHELRNMPKGRIPIYDEAAYRIVAPEPWIIQPDGRTNPDKGRLKGNVGFTHGLIGEAAMWRQPNGTSRERHVIDLVDVGKFQDWGDASTVFIGADVIPEVCDKLGTMDWDDTVTLTTNRDFVELFKHLPEFPEPEATERKPEPAAQEINPFQDEVYVVRNYQTWSHDWFSQRMAMELENRGVGFLANALMCAIVIHNGKESMLSDLADKLELEEDEDRRKEIIRRYANLEKWQMPNAIKQLGISYNDYIDMMKTGKSMGDVQELYDAIDKMYKDIAENLAFPWLWTIGGFDGKGRIPSSLRGKEGVWILRTELCRQLQHTEKTVQQVEEVLIGLEWRLSIPLPSELKAMFPADDEVKQWVSDLRAWWYQEWELARSVGNIESVDEDAFNAAYKRIIGELDDTLAVCPHDLKVIWVELARRVYKQRWALPPVDDTGRLYHMRDRLCWAGMLAHAGLDAIEAAGLAGIRARVDLDQGCRHLSGPFYVHVKAENGVITLAKDGRVIGGANVPDGDWTMHQGMILVRPSAEIMRVTPPANSKQAANNQ